ncbi:hypothetical protein [Methylobacterium sp.]|uniref:hypothetical protein n=1 Tax=Methylobacterium sp. TaxID=409 RepID=UPI003C78C7D4
MSRARTLARILGRKSLLFALWIAAFGLLAEIGKTSGLTSSDRAQPSEPKEAIHVGP